MIWLLSQEWSTCHTHFNFIYLWSPISHSLHVKFYHLRVMHFLSILLIRHNWLSRSSLYKMISHYFKINGGIKMLWHKKKCSRWLNKTVKTKTLQWRSSISVTNVRIVRSLLFLPFPKHSGHRKVYAFLQMLTNFSIFPVHKERVLE